MQSSSKINTIVFLAFSVFSVLFFFPKYSTYGSSRLHWFPFFWNQRDHWPVLFSSYFSFPRAYSLYRLSLHLYVHNISICVYCSYLSLRLVNPRTVLSQIQPKVSMSETKPILSHTYLTLLPTWSMENICQVSVTWNININYYLFLSLPFIQFSSHLRFSDISFTMFTHVFEFLLLQPWLEFQSF